MPDHTRQARRLLGPGPVIAPEHKVILETDSDIARRIGRPFVADPYLKLRNYTTNLLRHGYTDHDIADGGSDGLIDALVLHGTIDTVAAGLRAPPRCRRRPRRYPSPHRQRHNPMPAYHQLAHALL